MKTQEYDHLLKILVLGDRGTGKTSLISQHCDHIFVENNTYQNNTYLVSTDRNPQGDAFKTCNVFYNDRNCKITIWKYYDKHYGRSNYGLYRGAQCIFIVFDCTDFQSFENVPRYIQECERYAREDVPIIIVGCKIDDIENRVVTQSDAIDLATALGLPYFEVNSKDPSPFEKQTFYKIFQTATQIIIDKFIEEEAYKVQKSSNIVSLKPPKLSKKSILKFWRDKEYNK